jgi:hypothetical protein
MQLSALPNVRSPQKTKAANFLAAYSISGFALRSQTLEHTATEPAKQGIQQ